MFATPNLSCVMRERKGDEWQGVKDKTHISLKGPDEWIRIAEGSGFTVLNSFGDGLWDSPYWAAIPTIIQKLVFGLPAALQVLAVGSFIPVRWGENLVVIAKKATSEPSSQRNVVRS